MIAGAFDQRRAEAVDGTTLQPSKFILSRFPRLVSHPSPSGIDDLHYTDADYEGAICCTAAEATMLFELVEYSGATRLVEIGSYVGWSSAHIASGGVPRRAKLTCIDPMSEHRPDLPGSTPTSLETRFLENIAACGLRSSVTLVRGRSPEVLPEIAPSDGWDFAFVDGLHLHGQPLKDVQGVLPHLAEGAPIVLHDLYLPDVRDARDWLSGEGWHGCVLPTANLLTVCWKGDQPPDWWPAFAASISMRGLLHPQAVSKAEALSVAPAVPA